jgi:hypothetical protein
VEPYLARVKDGELLPLAVCVRVADIVAVELGLSVLEAV